MGDRVPLLGTSPEKKMFWGGKGPPEPGWDVTGSWDTGGSTCWQFPGTGAGRAWESPGASRDGDVGMSRERASRDGDTGTSFPGEGSLLCPRPGAGGTPCSCPCPQTTHLARGAASPGSLPAAAGLTRGFWGPQGAVGVRHPPCATPQGAPGSSDQAETINPRRGTDPAAPEAPAAQIPPMQGAPVQRPRQSSPAPHHGELPRGEPAGPRAALAAARGSGLLLLTVLAACADNSDREPLRSRY